MQDNPHDPYQTRNTRFIVRLKPSTQRGDLYQANSNDRIYSELFKDDVDYSIIPNLKNSSVYISSTTYSGKLLNSHPKVRDETNNRFLFPTASEKYDFDGVYYDNCRQEDFYNENVLPLLPYLLRKVNSIVIAHGPQRYYSNVKKINVESAGKSFTMREHKVNRLGVVPRFAENLISTIQPTKFKLYLTVVQIYKDWIFDLLRIDTDISHYLESNYDTGGISTVKIDGSDHFKNVFENALEKARTNCTITSKNQTKFHLVVRFSLFEETKTKKSLYSKIDFVDLVESSFLSNQNSYETSEAEWLQNSFNILHNFLEKSYSSDTYRKKSKLDILTSFLDNNAASSSDGKLLFISCLSPSVGEIQENRSALEFASGLRQSHSKKSGRRLSSTTIREHTAISTIPDSAESDEDTRRKNNLLETSFKARLHLLREKLSKINIFSDSTEHLERWLDQQENEITQLEDETNSLFSNDKTLPYKLKEINLLKNEIQSIRATFHQSESSARTVTSSQETQREHKRRDSQLPRPSSQRNRLALNLPLKKDTNSVLDTKRRYMLDHSRDSLSYRSRSHLQHQQTPNFEAPLFSSNNVSLSKPNGTLSDYPKRLSVDASGKGLLHTDRTVNSIQQPNSSPILKNIINQMENNMKYDRELRGQQILSTEGVAEDDFFSLKRPELKSKDTNKVNILKKEFKDIQKDARVDRSPVVPKIHGINQINNHTKKISDHRRLSEAFAEERRHSLRASKQPSETRNPFRELSSNDLEIKSIRGSSEDRHNIDFENMKLKEGISLLAEQLKATANESQHRVQDYQQKLSQLEQENLELTDRIRRSGSKKENLHNGVRESGAKRLQLLSTQDNSLQSSRQQSRIGRAQSLGEPKDIKKLSNNKENVLLLREGEDPSVRNLQIDLDHVKRKLTVFEDELLSTKKETFHTHREYNNSSQEVSELRNQLMELTNRFNTQQDELSNERMRKRQVEAKCEDLEEKIITLENENNSFYEKLKMKGEHEKRVDSISGELKEAKSENFKLQDEKSKFSREKLLLEEEINKRDMTIEELKKQVMRLQNTGKDAQKYISKSHKLKDKRDKLLEENGILKHELKKAQEKTLIIENNMQGIKEENYTLKREKDRIELELRILRPEINRSYLNSYRGGIEDEPFTYRDRTDRRMSYEKRSYSPNRTSGRKTLQSRLEERESKVHDNFPHLIKKTE